MLAVKWNSLQMDLDVFDLGKLNKQKLIMQIFWRKIQSKDHNIMFLNKDNEHILFKVMYMFTILGDDCFCSPRLY